MTQTQKKVTYYSLASISLIVSIIFIFIRKGAIEKYFDAETGFYLADAALPKTLQYGLFAVAVLYVLAYFIPRLTKTSEFELKPPSSVIVFASAYTGFVFFAFILSGVKSYLKIMKDRNLLKNPDFFDIIIIILAIPAAMHFFSKITADGRRSDKRAILGLMPVLWCLAYVFILYFDRTILINNPHKILTQITFVAMALFLLFEARFPLGRPKSCAYLTFALIAQLLTGTLAVPNLLYFFKNAEPLKVSGESHALNNFLSTIMTGTPLVQSVLYDFIALGFFLYTTGRLFSLATAGKMRPRPSLGEAALVPAAAGEAPAADEPASAGDAAAETEPASAGGAEAGPAVTAEPTAEQSEAAADTPADPAGGDSTQENER